MKFLQELYDIRQDLSPETGLDPQDPLWAPSEDILKKGIESLEATIAKCSCEEDPEYVTQLVNMCNELKQQLHHLQSNPKQSEVGSISIGINLQPGINSKIG